MNWNDMVQRQQFSCILMPRIKIDWEWAELSRDRDFDGMEVTRGLGWWSPRENSDIVCESHRKLLRRLNGLFSEVNEWEGRDWADKLHSDVLFRIVTSKGEGWAMLNGRRRGRSTGKRPLGLIDDSLERNGSISGYNNNKVTIILANQCTFASSGRSGQWYDFLFWASRKWKLISGLFLKNIYEHHW